MGGCVTNRQTITLWLQKYYIHSEFKPNDVFSLFYIHICKFILWGMKEKNLKKIK